MARTINDIVADIDGMTASTADELDLERLDVLCDEFFSLPRTTEQARAWFKFYERHPEGDGAGVFWSILHGLEGMEGSDVLVVESVHRLPAEFPVTMVNRIINAGVMSVGDIDLLDLLRSVAANSDSHVHVRGLASRFLRHQAAKGR